MKGTIAELAKYRINIFPGVNTLFNGLANQPDFAKLDFSGLAITNGGGMAVQESVAKKWLAITGCPIVEGYGLSETSAGVTCNPTDSEAYTGTIGLPLPNVEIKIIDDQGREVPLGEPGEIAIKGPQVMQGYWQRPDETARAFLDQGGVRWMRTGDLVRMDDEGYFHFYDRSKDLIKFKGYSIFAKDVEDVLYAHPQVKAAGVIGVPDPAVGQRIKAIVVLQGDARGKLSEDEIKAYCRQSLAEYKVPHIVEFRGELPKTDVGKVSRRELRDETKV
jgi:long-chain acyl-CoA synthetase